MASARIQQHIAQQTHHQRAPMQNISSPPVELDSSTMATLENGDPEHCVTLTHNPSVHVYYALKSRIESSAPSWLQQFLELDGLGSLINTLEQLSRSSAGTDGSFSGAILQLDCLSCVKAVLNTNIGMTYFLQHQNYTRKLVMGEYLIQFGNLPYCGPLSNCGSLIFSTKKYVMIYSKFIFCHLKQHNFINGTEHMQFYNIIYFFLVTLFLSNV